MAVDRVVTMIIRFLPWTRRSSTLSPKTKTKGTLFFVEADRCWKNRTTKSIAEFIFGDENNCIRFDMSEFSQEHADQRLIGAPPAMLALRKEVS